MGHLHLLPVFFPAGTELQRMITYAWHGEPAAMAASGVDSSGERVLFMAMEQALDYAMPRSRQGMELIHVQRFRVDCGARGEHDPINGFRFNKDDPPDLFVHPHGGGAEVGLECTRLADSERQRKHGHLEQARTILRSKPRSDLKHLQGTVVYVGFDALSQDAAASDQRLRRGQRTDALVEMIITHEPNPESLRVDDGQLPAQGPDPHMDRGPGGISVHAVPLTSTHDPSSFMRQAGFELALAGSTAHSWSAAWSELQATVTAKDKPGNDWVLITAGGPDRNGRIHPLEGVLAEFLMETPGMLSAAHLQRVLLHSWTSGAAWELYPAFRELAAPATSAPALPNSQISLPLVYPRVEMPTELQEARNTPCPCGSGRKYKLCHGSW